MIHEFTKTQLAQLHVAKNRPLIICDVDEVIVHFTKALETYLDERGMWLDTSSFAISGNIRFVADNSSASDAAVSVLIDQFFTEKTAVLEPIEGAVASINQLADQANIVLLTNLPHHAREKRIINMQTLGISHPVITNSGPKGPAINHLASLTEERVVFIDDSPGFISSAYHHAPDVHLIHFLQDERFARHLAPFPFASLTTDSWTKALPHIEKLLA